jgi:hypothetical protein
VLVTGKLAEVYCRLQENLFARAVAFGALEVSENKRQIRGAKNLIDKSDNYFYKIQNLGHFAFVKHHIL